MAGRAEWGSDVVVEMLKQYGIEYAPANLGATYRGLLDSIINFGENKTPEIIECLHEEIAVLGLLWDTEGQRENQQWLWFIMWWVPCMLPWPFTTPMWTEPL